MGIINYWYYKLRVALMRAVGDWGRFVATRLLGVKMDYYVIMQRRTRTYSIPSSRTSRRIRINAWDPPNATKPRPVHITFHGSGHVYHVWGDESGFCEHISQKLGITVLDCEYAKSPEYPFPTAYEEVIDVIRHVLGQPDVYDVNNITLGGFSAGGGLSFAFGTHAAPELRKYIKAIVAVYPWVNLDEVVATPPEGKPGSTGMRISPYDIHTWVPSYLMNTGLTARDTRVSPYFATDAQLALLPQKICVVTAELDNLKPQAIELAERIRDVAKKDVWIEDIKDVHHTWITTSGDKGWEYERKVESFRYIERWFREEVYGPKTA